MSATRQRAKRVPAPNGMSPALSENEYPKEAHAEGLLSHQIGQNDLFSEPPLLHEQDIVAKLRDGMEDVAPVVDKPPEWSDISPGNSSQDQPEKEQAAPSKVSFCL